MRRSSIVAVVFALAFVVSLGLGVWLDDNSAESVWPGAVDMMRVLPADVGDFSYRDVSMFPPRWWEDFIWQEMFHSETFMGQSWERVLNMGYCDREHILLWSGSLDLDAIRRSLDSSVGGEEYRNVTVWIGHTYSWAILNHIVLTGYHDDVRRCIDAAKGAEPSLYDDENYRGVLNRLPKGMRLSLRSPERESEYNPGLLVEGTSKTEDNGTLIETTVYCYGDGRYAVWTDAP